MQDEIHESMDLGVMLLIAIAIIAITMVICKVCRDGYVYRERDIVHNENQSKSFSWQDLHVVYNVDGCEVKEFGGAIWARVLYQDISENTNYFDDTSQLYCSEPGRFSRLALLENYRKPDGTFEFILDYPDAYGIFKDGYNRWIQSTNPVTQQRTNWVGNNASAPGYTAIHTDFNTYAGAGIEFNGSECVLDGILGHSNWWLCCGIRNHSFASTNTSSHPYTMPGPWAYTSGMGTGATSMSQGVTQCELWARIDDANVGIATDVDNMLKWLQDYSGRVGYVVLEQDPNALGTYVALTNMAELSTINLNKLAHFKTINSVKYNVTPYEVAQYVMSNNSSLIAKSIPVSNYAEIKVFEDKLFFDMAMDVNSPYRDKISGDEIIPLNYELGSEPILVFIVR